MRSFKVSVFVIYGSNLYARAVSVLYYYPFYVWVCLLHRVVLCIVQLDVTLFWLLE